MWGKKVSRFFVINIKGKGPGKNAGVLRYKWRTKLRFPLNVALKWYKSGLCILIKFGLHM
jgi:hypothetical protein